MNVVFFPRKDYDVEICGHRLGKKMTYTECTDQFRFDTVVDNVDYFTWIMNLTRNNGVKPSFFARYSDLFHSKFQLAKQYLNAGELWIDEYSWTPELADKISTGSDITPSEFIQSYNNTLLPPFIEKLNRKPVCLSYSYGNSSFEDGVCPLYLGARNSTYISMETDYGNSFGNPNNIPYSFTEYKVKKNTIRWYDLAKQDNTFDDKIATVASLIDASLLNGGWVRNFTHFDDMLSDGNVLQAEKYYNMLSQKNANNEIYFAGYGEAVAYLVYRESISKAVMYSPIGEENNRLIIRLEAPNVFNVDTDLLQVPISVKFSTVGTPLENRTIRCNYNLIGLGNGQYIVEIPYSKYAGAVIEKVD